jgi:Glycosyl transferase family 4
VVLSPDLAVLTTVLWVAVMANSVNFIDGLDGLATGIVAIGAGAFFVYSHQLGVVGNIQASNAGPLIAIVAVGLAVGFLPHNFYPAKIFMGDGGAMLLGVLVAASTLAVVGQDPYEFSGRTYFFFAPILIPFFILGIPLLDTVFAIVRRAGQRTSPAVADLNHLHHRLMRLGHGQRRAVIILWAWTALLSGIVLWPGVTNSHNEIPPIAVGGLSVLLYTLFAPRGRTALANADNNVHEAGNGSAARDGSAARNGTAVRDQGPVRNGSTGLSGAGAPNGARYMAAAPAEPNPGAGPATSIAAKASAAETSVAETSVAETSAAERNGAAAMLSVTGATSLEGFPVTGAALVPGPTGQRKSNGNGDITLPLATSPATPPRGLPVLRVPKPPN